jgi:acyl transferase domain-containing protein
MNDRGKRLSRMSEAKLELFGRELERLQADAKRRVEPIAVVGMACRFPGGISTPSAFWSLLESGRDLRSAPPAERGWGGKTPPGYFIHDAFRFDAALFGMSPREARSIDPQQRLLLEVTWQAVEDAGYAPLSLEGARAGVYVGAYADDYAHQLVWSGDVDGVDGYTSTGTSHAVSVGRVAHVFGLRGPAMAIDTACSSSLVAVHLACAALRAGECDLALVGGVSLALSAETPFALQRARMLADDGRSKTFAAAADGYGRGEGCGVVVLRRLSDAEAAKQRVLSLVRGSAVNHDGHASSLTAPNGSAQVDVIRRALDAAGLAPHAVDAIECHGTGTPLGDPIEVQALREVFADDDRATRPLRLSAVKSNLGHLEAAAGIAGLIKTVLALQHRKLPASLHVDALNPELSADGDWMKVTQELEPWQHRDGARVAGVSSFGFGGTNAHVVLEQAPALSARAEADDGASRILTLSAATNEGLCAIARGVAEHLKQEDLALSDLCLTANVGRSVHRHRATVSAENVEQLSEGLAALAAGLTHTRLRRSHAPATPPACVFMFAGQGAQFAGMGRELFERLPTFRTALLDCEEILQDSLGRRLTTLLYGEDAKLLADTTYAQPALFAFEYALAQVWLSQGILPGAFLGHSVGEYVAAHFAGVFDLETGLRLIAQRGKLMGSLPAGGAMLALLAEPSWIEQRLGRYPDLEVAALNGPNNVVVSGGEASVLALQHAAQLEGVRGHRLEVSHAFHSALMEPMLAGLESFVAGQALAVPTRPLLSNLTGGWADERVATPAYWVEHLRRTVRFADNLDAARGRDLGLMLELGPSTTLSSMARQALGSDLTIVPSLRAGRDDFACLSEASQTLFLAGARPTWTFLQETAARR